MSLQRSLMAAGLALASVLAPQPSFARERAAPTVQSEAGTRQALAAEITQLMDYAGAVDAWKKAMLAAQAIGQCGCGVPKEVQAKMTDAWGKAVNDEFNVQEVVTVLEQTAAETLSVQEMREVVAFRKSPLGLKLRAIEQANRQLPRKTDPAAVEKQLGAARKALDAKPARKALLKKLVELAGGSRSMADLSINMSLGTAMGATALKSPNQPGVSPEDVIEMVESMRPMLEKSYDKTLVPFYAQIYARVSDNELKSLIKVMATPPGRKFTAMSNAALSHALRVQTLKMGKSFAREMQGEKI